MSSTDPTTIGVHRALHEAVMIQEHLLAQDKVLESLASKLDASTAGPDHSQ